MSSAGTLAGQEGGLLGTDQRQSKVIEEVRDSGNISEMDRDMSRALFPAVLLLLATGATATSTEAQNPASKRKASAVGTVLSADTPAAPKMGSVRQLVCRGSAGLHVATEHDPSPRNPRLVAVSIGYPRSSQAVGPQYENLEPGACSWSNGGITGIPPEPGVVHFDIDREGSASVPDPTTLQEYLRDPEHYWVFYVDDVTNFSLSHGPHRGRFWAGDKRDGKSRTSVA